MSSRNRYGKFGKKHYVGFLKYTVWLLCRQFGYRKQPYLLETQFPHEKAMMCLEHCGNEYAIFYDYKNFKKNFGEYSFREQKLILVGIVAHEMRHYYQHRQMFAKKPRESEEIIARWKQDELGECTHLPRHLQPLELDASLFALLFLDRKLNVLSTYAIKDQEHVDALEKLYIEYYGETNEDIFEFLRQQFPNQ